MEITQKRQFYYSVRKGMTGKARVLQKYLGAMLNLNGGSGKICWMKKFLEQSLKDE